MKTTVLFVTLALTAGIVMSHMSSADSNHLSHGSSLSDAPNQRVELGRVHWMRDIEQAKSVSSKTGKPIFMLFQEVPG